MFETAISEVDKKIVLFELLTNDQTEKKLCDVWFSDPQREFMTTSGEFVLWQDSLSELETEHLIDCIWQFELNPENPSLLQLLEGGTALLFHNDEFHEGQWLLSKDYFCVTFNQDLEMELFCMRESEEQITSLAILLKNQVKLVRLKASVLAVEPKSFMRSLTENLVTD